jgi:hypothetical protein
LMCGLMYSCPPGGCVVAADTAGGRRVHRRKRAAARGDSINATPGM